MSKTPDRKTSSAQELARLRTRVRQLEQQVDRLKGVEEATKREKDRLHAVLMNMPVMIDAFDAQGNLVLWNRECERVTGYRAAEVLGNPEAMEWLYPDPTYREEMMRQWEQRGDDYRNWRWQMTAKDGSIKSVAWSNLSKRILIAPWKTWGIGVDVTEQTRAEEALRESERQLKDVLDNLPVGVYRTSPNGRTLMANPACVRMLGYASFDELAGQNLEDVSRSMQYPRPAFKERLEKEGRVTGFESAWKKQDGSTVSVLENARIVRDAQGRVLYYEGTLEDISERAAIVAALRESENRYRTLVESAGESIAVVNERGMFLFMNTTGAERLGGKPGDYVGKTMWDVFPREIADRQMEYVQAAVRTGRGTNVNTVTALRGMARWYNTSVEPLKDANGQVHSVLVIARDIHDLVQTQKELEEYRSRMAHTERLAALGTLSATVVHEMNQPLTVIRLTLQDCLARLADTHAIQEVTGDLQECLDQVTVISAVINRFKGFARKSSHGHPAKTNLLSVAERVVRVWNDMAEKRKVSLALDGLDEIGQLHVDGGDVEQIFFSLVENAVQAADGATGHTLSVTGARRGRSVEIRFADDCGGIAPQHVDRIFEPFFTTKSGDQGTGLGLCIVQQALSRVGGKIHVENRPGKGVTFIVTVPLAEDA
jgi:PAS domain S-box-containing protein